MLPGVQATCHLPLLMNLLPHAPRKKGQQKGQDPSMEHTLHCKSSKSPRPLIPPCGMMAGWGTQAFSSLPDPQLKVDYLDNESPYINSFCKMSLNSS